MTAPCSVQYLSYDGALQCSVFVIRRRLEVELRHGTLAHGGAGSRVRAPAGARDGPERGRLVHTRQLLGVQLSSDNNVNSNHICI